MAVVIQGSQITNNGATTGTSIDVTKVSGISVGELLVMIVWCNPTETTNQITTPSGWTLIKTAAGVSCVVNIGAYYRIADGTEPATTTVSLTTGAACHTIGAYLRLTGFDPLNPIDAVSGTGQGSASPSYTPPSTNTNSENAYKFAVVGQDSGSGVISIGSGSGTISGWGENQASTSPGVSSGVSLFLCPLATTSYPVTFSSTNSAAWTGASFHIKEFPAGIDTVTPSEFDMDETSLVVVGNNFLSPQSTGAIYISDAATLAGSANEVDVSSAVTAWSNTSITLNLTNLSVGELADLDTLGPGARYVIITNSSSDEYGSDIVTMHRPIAIALSASANIAASGENTTAQLTAPSGKTTGDFGGGRIQDDENPADAVTTLVDEYIEDEWSLATTADAVLTKTYEFRVLYGTTPASTITLTPQVTITAFVPSTRRIFNL